MIKINIRTSKSPHLKKKKKKKGKKNMLIFWLNLNNNTNRINWLYLSIFDLFAILESGMRKNKFVATGRILPVKFLCPRSSYYGNQLDWDLRLLINNINEGGESNDCSERFFCQCDGTKILFKEVTKNTFEKERMTCFVRIKRQCIYSSVQN